MSPEENFKMGMKQSKRLEGENSSEKDQQELGPGNSSCVQVLGSLCLLEALKILVFSGTQSCVLWP